MSTTVRDRAIPLPFGRERVIAIALAALAMVLMIWPHLGYVPVWDGRIYANCIMDAAYNGLSVESLRCANHPSQGWAFVLALPQTLDPGNVALLNATNLVLGIVALIAIRVVLARMFPDPSHARDLDLLAAACALQPVVLSTLMQPNVDFGVYVFFFVALAGLLTPTRAGVAIAVLGGTLTVFSKETGVAAYGLAMSAVIVVEQVRAGVPVSARIDAIMRRAAVLLVPVALFIGHVLWWNATHQQRALWKHGWQQSATDGFKLFDLSDPVFVSYAAGLFVLGFMWVAWVPVAWDSAIGLVRMARRAPARPLAGADQPVVIAVTLVTAALTYALTSFRTWSNLRYFAVLYPLFMFVFYAAVIRLDLSAASRRIVLRIIVVLFVLAGLRSVDPLSRVVYGTFDTGVRRMYQMTSITGEFDGPGRDQLVYNLEFTGYHDVQDALYERIRPDSATVIGTARHVRWSIWSQLDSVTRRRSMRRAGVVAPVYADEVDISVRQAPQAWYLDFSNHGAKDRALQSLLPLYRVTDTVVVTAGGQRLTAHHLVRREAGVLP